MTVTRRHFLTGLMATGVAAAAGPIAAAPATIHARPGAADLGHPSGAPTPIWGYAGTAPGPTLRLKQGVRLTRRFVNGLPQPSTIHWHGIRIANAMDGVPKLTQPLVEPGGDFLYDFVVPDAGTYWYHPHNRTWEQLARGLYGALIVEETSPPKVDRDDVLLIDDWRLSKDGTLHEKSFASLHEWAHGGRLGNWVTVNGKGEYLTRAKSCERLRLRLVNVANARIFTLSMKGMDGWIVALDGQPLATPERIAGPIVLAPAQRTDVIVDVTADAGKEAFLLADAGGEPVVIGALTVAGEARAARLDAPAALPANPVIAPASLDGARRVPLIMEGGAMGGLRSAQLNGENLGMRELAGAGYVWAFNGVANLPDEPLVAANLGEVIVIPIVNRTAWPHAMHLHGHHFVEARDGAPMGPLRDTLLVAPETETAIAFVADNTGKWLFHCHMVEHAASGMSTWITVN